MSLRVTLATERERRKAAEAELAKLRPLLGHVAPAAGPAPLAAQELAQQLSQTKQRLEDEQDLVRQVIDFSPNLVYVTDEAGHCILANARYTQLLAQQAAPASPTPGALAAAPGTLAPAQPPATTAFEEHYQLKTGETLVYRTTQRPLVRSDGTRYLLTFSSDITDLKHAHQLAHELAQTKQLFMANLSHEIRTPLHGIMGLVELLRKGELSDEQADYLGMILHTTDNLLTVVNNTLDFTKLEAGQTNLESVAFDLLQVVQRAADSFTFKTAEKGLRLRLRLVSPDAGLPLVQGDPHRLHQILVNLLSNAIKFTNRGTITITVAAPPASEQDPDALPVTVSVEDTGIGISAASIGQIFNQFEQANPSITRLYGGTGLGLTICKNLVELQGGELGVRSAPGQGSCFYFTIPYTRSPEALPGGPAAPAAGPATGVLRGLTVLLVEDNAINQLIAVSMLGQWQVEVELAHNGEEAVLKAARRQYDLILMDIQMPQLDGLTATAQLRQTPGPNQQTPIVALTADAVRVATAAYQSGGFTDFLIKPYTEAAFYQLLVRIGQRLPAPALAPVLPPAGPELHYDFLTLGRLATDADFIRKMLQAFVARVPAQVQRLREAAAAADWPVVSREAHSLKTTFGSLNIHPTTEHLQQLEALAEAPAAQAGAAALLPGIDRAAGRFTALFTQRLAELP